MADQKVPAAKAGQGPLTKKLGPLPVWVWALIAGVIVIAFSMSRNGKDKKRDQAAQENGGTYGDNPNTPYGIIGGDQRPPVVFESFQTQIQAPPMGGRPFPPCAPPPPGPCAPAPGRWIVVAPWKKHGAPWDSTCRGMAERCYGDGSRWPQIWGAPENAALRHRRRDCDHIQAGDRIWIPPLGPGGVPCDPAGPGPFSPGPPGGGVPAPGRPGGAGMPPPPPPPMPSLPHPPGPPGPPEHSMPPGRSGGGRHSRSQR